jgi:hypothetical protein
MTKTNELDWKEYEAITKYIFENLGAKSGIKIKGYGRNFWVTGKSGEKHQVDVLTEQVTGDQKLQTAIECKFVKKKVTKEIVMKLHSVMEDAGINSGIIVCKAGYTKSTMNYAAHKGIKLIELREAGEEDLKEQRVIDVGILDINIDATLTRPIITEIDLGTKTITDQKEIMGMYKVTMFNADGKEVYFKTCLFEFLNDLEQYDVLMRMTRNSYTPFGGRLTWNNNGEELVIREIKITGYLTRKDSSSKKTFQIVDHVWLIMNEIFENRRTTLSKSGMMYNLPLTF